MRRRELARTGVNHVAPKAAVTARALEIAARIAEKPRMSVELLKRTLSLPRRQAFETSITTETLMHHISLDAPEARARIENAHVE